MAGVKQDRDGAVGILTLNEPASLNAMTPDLLGGACRRHRRDDRRSRDPGAGADRRGARILLGPEFEGGRSARQGHRRRGDDALYWPAFRALRECRVPIVVAVNGVAAGGGFSLAMAGDIIVAARSASFIQVFSRIGLVPDLGSTWLLPRLIGRQRALELMLLNEPLSAERAQEWGLVRQVVDDGQLLGEAMKLAQRLAQGPTRALVATRALIEESEHASYAAQFRKEIETQAEVRQSADALEGRNAFVEKRAARFSGR